MPIEEFRQHLISGVSRERLLDAAGFRFVEDTRDAIERLRRARKSKSESIAIRACEVTLELADVRYKRPHDVSDPTQPVRVEIVIPPAQAPSAPSLIEMPRDDA
jgi:hypothetical protein